MDSARTEAAKAVADGGERVISGLTTQVTCHQCNLDHDRLAGAFVAWQERCCVWCRYTLRLSRQSAREPR